MTTIKTIISPIEQIGIIILICLISLTCLTSCGGSGDDDLMVSSQPEPGTGAATAISFSCSESMEAAVTRAAGTPLSDAATSFRVWAYKSMSYDVGTQSYSNNQTVMPNYTVNYGASTANTTSSNTNGWEYVNQQTGVEPEQTIKYWDWGAAAYRFFAVTGWGGNLPADPEEIAANKAYKSNETSSVYEFTMLADASSEVAMASTPYFSHLWFSTGNADVYPDKQFGKPVTLEFLKPYTRVRFIFKYVYPREGIVLGSPSFKSTNDDDIVRKGTFTVSYPLTGTATSESFTVTPDGTDAKVLDAFTEDYDPDDDTKVYTVSNKGWYTVLPNIGQGSYTLSVTVNGAAKYAVVPAEYMHWLPGYSYTYIFKITEEGGIEIGWVEYVMTPWTEMESTWTVYNW